MFGFFKRLFKIGQSEAHSALEKIENPIRLTEQGLRDMRNDLNQSMEALAQVKAMAIRSKHEIEENTAKAKDYENKAMLLLKRGQSGEIDPAEADRLAKEALTRKDECLQHVVRATQENGKFSDSVDQLERNAKKIRSNISKWDNELRTLKARVKVTKATKKLNKQLAQIDTSSTVSMLERMKEKVAQEEALAESYGDLANESKSLDDEIEKALDGTTVDVDNELAELKSKMGIS